MGSLFIFGLGYTAQRIAAAALPLGFEVNATGSAGNIAFDDVPSVALALSRATHVISSVPPVADGDPVLRNYDEFLGNQWLGYLSSTGVYGDAGGAWVDETAPIGGRRRARNEADAEWLRRNARVFRLPGIYGPGRSALDRMREGRAHRVSLPDQVFSRVHVEDIATAVIAGFEAPSGAYNIADDYPCDQNRVVEHAAALLGLAPPAFVDPYSLSNEARAFYAENRRVANGKAKRILGWVPRYPDFVAGLEALNAISKPIIASVPPAAAKADQR